MRCARCNGLTVPQAIGYTPEGHVVFGWCVSCLEESGCLDIKVARTDRLVASRPLASETRASKARPRATARPRRKETEPNRDGDDRGKVVSAVALVLALWGLALLSVGLVLGSRPTPRPASPLGNGSPPLFIAGGSAVAAVGLGLWFVVSGRTWLGTRLGLKAVQAVSFLAALTVIGAGIFIHSPRRVAFVVAFATLALAVSVTARWLELRRFRRAARGWRA